MDGGWSGVSVRVLVMATMLFVALLGSARSDAAAMRWSAAQAPDGLAPFYAPARVLDVACAPGPMCAAVDSLGNVTASGDPDAATPPWTTPVHVFPANQATAIACVSVALCVAGDGQGAVSISTDPLGPEPGWSAPVVIDSASLNGIACPSTSLCVAVDSTGTVLVSVDPTAANPSWMATKHAGGGDGFNRVACAVGGVCAAIGASGTAFSTDDAATGLWTATTIDTDRSSCAYARDPANCEPSLTSIVCPSGQLCIAGDAAGHVLVSTDPGAPAPSWSPPEAIDPFAGTAFGPGISDIACPSVSLCVALDGRGDALASADPADTNSSWSAPTAIEVSPGNGSDVPIEISCTTPSLCVVLDNSGRTAVSTAPTVAGSWSAPLEVDSSGANILTAIDCGPGRLCVAVDNRGHEIATGDPGAGTPRWSAASIDPTDQLLSGASCPSRSLCVAVDGSGHVAVSRDPLTSAAWSIRPVDPGVALNAVSCPARSLCLAVDAAGYALRSTNPAAARRWQRELVQPGRVLSGVSCPSPAFCFAVDTQGDVFDSADPAAPAPHWHGPLSIDSALAGVSCPSIGLCIAYRAVGDADLSADPRARHPDWRVAAGLAHAIGPVVGATCGSMAFCVGLGTNGETAVTTDPLAAHPTWQTAPLPPAGAPAGLSCLPNLTCVAIEGDGVATGGSLPVPARTAIATSLRSQLATPRSAIGPGRRIPIATLSRGRLELTWTTGGVLLGSGTQHYTVAGQSSVALKLTRTGRRVLSRDRKLAVTAHVAFTTPGVRNAIRVSRHFTIT